MTMGTAGRGKYMGSVKYSLVLREDRSKVMVQRGCLNGADGMELANNSKMPFFE
jgi:hypothetical protein